MAKVDASRRTRIAQESDVTPTDVRPSARRLIIRPSFSDACKRILLGRPMITNDLHHEKLSNTVALGALSPDAISSTAYGPEQIMVELLPAAGLAAFVLLLPVIGVILLILALVAASYRQVVMAYTRAGGSHSGQDGPRDQPNPGRDRANRALRHEVSHSRGDQAG